MKKSIKSQFQGLSKEQNNNILILYADFLRDFYINFLIKIILFIEK
jgi:hypothetical protein